MDEEQKQIEYIKELGNQIRAEINELYTVNTAFLIINGFIVQYILSDCLPVRIIVVIIIVNIIWQICIKINCKWIHYWIDKAKEIKALYDYNIWIANHKIRFLNYFGIKSFFLLLPIAMNSFILIGRDCACGNACSKYSDLGFIVPIITVFILQIFISYGDYQLLSKIHRKFFIIAKNHSE